MYPTFILAAVVALLSAPALADPPPVDDLLRALGGMKAVSLEHSFACGERRVFAAQPSDGRPGVKCVVGPDVRGTTCARLESSDAGMMRREPGHRVFRPTHPAAILCEDHAAPRVEPPEWMHLVVRAARDGVEIIPFDDRSGLLLSADGVARIALAHRGTWRLSRQGVAVDVERPVGPTRTFDTTPLTGRPSRGVVTTVYDGGSGMGHEQTWLTVFALSTRGIRRVASLQIGHFEWWKPERHLAGEPTAGEALDRAQRPHFEVRLAPRIAGRALALEAEGAVKACETVRAWKGTDRGYVESALAVCDHMGRWRLDGDRFTRATAARRGRQE